MEVPDSMKPNPDSSPSPAPARPVVAAAEPAGPRRLVMRLALVLGSLLVAAVLAELVLTLFFQERFAFFEDERSLLYRYHATLGWFPIPNSHDRFMASRVINVVNNGEGFRAPELTPGEKPGIVFLGDSFVWGFDVEAPERFTEKLQAKHPDWNIFNLGVSGYGTDQEYLLLQQQIDRYKPKVVFLVFCVESDDDDNSTNARYGRYYKPYFTESGGQLQLHGVPVPRSERVFLAEHERLARSCVAQLFVRAWFRLTTPAVVHNPDPSLAIVAELQKYLRNKGAILCLGLTRSHPALEEFLRRAKIPFVDLSTTLRYAAFGAHWTPEGHSFVCDRIDELLIREKVWETASSPGK